MRLGWIRDLHLQRDPSVLLSLRCVPWRINGHTSAIVGFRPTPADHSWFRPIFFIEIIIVCRGIIDEACQEEMLFIELERQRDIKQPYRVQECNNALIPEQLVD